MITIYLIDDPGITVQWLNSGKRTIKNPSDMNLFVTGINQRRLQSESQQDGVLFAGAILSQWHLPCFQNP